MDWEGEAEPELEEDEVDESEAPLSGCGLSEPPAASESCAKPTEAGDERKTEYTFFCESARVESTCACA